MAKRFRFRLQPVLRFRELKEQERLRDFAEANRAVDEVRMQIRHLEQEREETQEMVRSLYEDKADFQQIMEAYRYMNSVGFGILMNDHKRKELQKVADQKKGVFVEARKKRRVLEILRDKQKDAHRQEEARQEQADLDEQAVRLQMRRRQEES